MELCNNVNDDDKKNIPWAWVMFLFGIITAILYLFWTEYNTGDYINPAIMSELLI